MVWRGLDGQMITDTKEIAKRLRIEAGCWRDYHGDATLFDMSSYLFTKSMLTILGIDYIDAMDMRVHELFDKLADLIDPQER